MAVAPGGTSATRVRARSGFEPRGLLPRLLLPVLRRKTHQFQRRILGALRQLAEAPGGSDVGGGELNFQGRAHRSAAVTRLLYYDTVEGEYLRRFGARVVATGEGWVQLDQTAFHVEGGGQPADTGALRFPGGEARIAGVRQEGDVVKHLLAAPAPALAPGLAVEGEVDWARRLELMRGHTSGHLLAQAAWRLLNAKTVGNSIDVGRLRIDVRPARLTPADLRRLEDEVNQAVARDRAVRVRMMDRGTLESRVGERALLELSPPGEVLRAIEVQDYDLCPCSGTHVARTAEVGGVKLLKRESKGQGTDRVTYQLVTSPEP